jgi:lipopolysaccharide export system protein LptA
VLKAIAITIHSDLGTPQSGKEAFNLIEASGQVTVTENNSRASADAATFNMKTQIAVMTGNVVLSQGSNILSGEKLTVDLNSGIARVEQVPGGRIKGVFTPSAASAPAGE